MPGHPRADAWDMIVRARRLPAVGSLRVIDNPRARLCGPMFLLCALVIAANVPKADDWGGRIAVAALALILLAMSWRFWISFRILVRPRVVRLRNAFWTRSISRSDITDCRPSVTSKGLMYVAAIPELVLNDGSTVLLKGVQWSPQDELEAQADCDALLAAIRDT